MQVQEKKNEQGKKEISQQVREQKGELEKMRGRRGEGELPTRKVRSGWLCQGTSTHNHQVM